MSRLTRFCRSRNPRAVWLPLSPMFLVTAPTSGFVTKLRRLHSLWNVRNGLHTNERRSGGFVRPAGHILQTLDWVQTSGSTSRKNPGPCRSDSSFVTALLAVRKLARDRHLIFESRLGSCHRQLSRHFSELNRKGSELGKHP